MERLFTASYRNAFSTRRSPSVQCLDSQISLGKPSNMGWDPVTNPAAEMV